MSIEKEKKEKISNSQIKEGQESERKDLMTNTTKEKS